MLRFYADVFHNIFSEVRFLTTLLIFQRDREGFEARVSSGDVATAKRFLKRLQSECKDVEMKRTVERLDRFESLLLNFEHSELNDLIREYEEIQRAGYLDLKEKLFLYAPDKEAEYYDKDDLFGVKNKFPAASKEIKSAGNCYATGNYTACVFHLMRAVEIGGKSLLSYMRATKHLPKVKGGVKGKPVALCTWGELKSAMQAALEEQRKTIGASVKKKETYQFCNEAVEAFGHFQNAWRDRVSHSSTIYDVYQAKSIMESTKQFMTHLAKRIGTSK